MLIDLPPVDVEVAHFPLLRFDREGAGAVKSRGRKPRSKAVNNDRILGVLLAHEQQSAFVSPSGEKSPALKSVFPQGLQVGAVRRGMKSW